MNRKLFFLIFLITSGVTGFSQTDIQSFKIKGVKLQELFDTYDSLEAVITISGDDATVAFGGYKGGSKTAIAEFKKRVKYNVEKFEDVPLRCYGKAAAGFEPKPEEYYYLVPTRILDLRSGKYYLCFRIKSVDNESSEFGYYKSLNPVPPGPPGFLFF